MVAMMGWAIPVQQGWRKGPWTPEEDKLLSEYVKLHGEGRWSFVARGSGLNRSGKSCRLRWVNYLRPGLKKGQITPQEEGIIIELHALWGNKWSTIARYLPGRTDNEIKNYWRTHFKKRERASQRQAKKRAQIMKQNRHHYYHRHHQHQQQQYLDMISDIKMQEEEVNNNNNNNSSQQEVLAMYNSPALEDQYQGLSCTSSLPVMIPHEDVASNNYDDNWAEELWAGLWDVNDWEAHNVDLDQVPAASFDNLYGGGYIY